MISKNLSMADNEEDEVVDGPAIAAQILSRMDSASKERIVASLKVSQPSLAAKIENKLLSFDEIADLTPQSIQTLIKSVDYKDLLLSLKTASRLVKDILFQNMSERKRDMLNEDFKALPPVRLSEVEEAQRRILLKLDELRTAGLVRSGGKHDIWV